MSHLHFDHAGGLLRADGARAFPQRDDRRPAGRVGDRARRQPAARGVATTSPSCALVSDWGAQGWADGEQRDAARASRSSRPAATRPATRRSSCAVAATTAGPLAFFGDLCMRPWSANPRWVTAFDDFPLDSVVRKAELFAQAADEDWLIVLSHEARHPIGRWSATATASGSSRSSSDSARARSDAGLRRRGARRRRQHRFDQRRCGVLVDRAVDDLPDDPVRVDEELGRQREDLVRVEDVARRRRSRSCSAGRTARRTLTSSAVVSWTLIPMISRPWSL